jgi:hypothetical protein
VLKDFGWADIFDLGDLKACRAMENMAAAWISINKAVGSTNFNFSLVRS